MKISLILPTHRISCSALARVFELASADPERFEVVVRDNSENLQKQELLHRIASPALRLFTVRNQGPFENPREALRCATGQFVLLLADDDWISMHGLEQVYRLARASESDASVANVTGTYLIDSSQDASMVRYFGLDSPDPAVRLRSFLQASGLNLLYYSAVRRTIAEWGFEFLEQLPYRFSFHDQLVSLWYLALGRTLLVDRLVYYYDLSEWETAERAFAKDRAMYVSAGLPVEIDRLHWLLCALEGALLLNSNRLGEKAHYHRKAMVDIWFRWMFKRFREYSRGTGFRENAVNAAVSRLRNGWLEQSQFDLKALLLSVCEVFDLADPQGAMRYFDFWSNL